MPPAGKSGRQLERDLDRMRRRQALVGVAAERPGHRQIALRHFDVGTDGELRRLARARGHGLGAPDRRTDEAFAVGIGRILFVQHHLLRGAGAGQRAGCRGGRRLRGAGLDPVGDLGSRIARRRRIADGLDRRRAQGAVERDHVRPLPQQQASDRDEDQGNDASLDEIAIGAGRPRLFFQLLLEFQIVIDRRRRCAPLLRNSGMRVVEARRRLEHRLGEIIVRGTFRAAHADRTCAPAAHADRTCAARRRRIPAGRRGVLRPRCRVSERRRTSHVRTCLPRADGRARFLGNEGPSPRPASEKRAARRQSDAAAGAATAPAAAADRRSNPIAAHPAASAAAKARPTGAPDRAATLTEPPAAAAMPD